MQLNGNYGQTSYYELYPKSNISEAFKKLAELLNTDLDVLQKLAAESKVFLPVLLLTFDAGVRAAADQQVHDPGGGGRGRGLPEAEPEGEAAGVAADEGGALGEQQQGLVAVGLAQLA